MNRSLPVDQALKRAGRVFDVLLVLAMELAHSAAIMMAKHNTLAILAMALIAASTVPGARAQSQSNPPAAAPAGTPPAPARDAALTPAQRGAVEDIVRRYIVENPEIIVEAVRAMRERQEREQQERQRENIASMMDRLINDPMTPVGGNPDGDVTIVEFFDYHCTFCKRVLPVTQEALETDKNIRYVYKEFPILNEESVYASRAATAAWLVEPAKYEVFRNALMMTRGALPAEKVMSIAAHVGLDIDKVQAAMKDPRVDAILRTNAELARAIGVNGTPAFIVGGRLVPGAVDIEGLRRLVAEARGS